MKKYNNQTGCYKIDVFVDGTYLWSTDKFKTCKAAKIRAIELLPWSTGKVTAHFNKI
jgi:hypothetical protein